MATIALDLSQFKSAGVYTIEIDQSQRISVTTQSLRLVVGWSPVGVQNAPVFIRSTKERQKFYGDYDKKSERKGSFFHRSIDTCLLSSPVFAISLLNVNQSPDVSNTDKVNYTAFSVDCASSNTPNFAANETINKSLYSNFFNKERFWKADPEYLQGVIMNAYSATEEQSAPILQLVNLGTSTVSFIIRKAIGLNGYNVYAKDWYGSESNIPYQWIRPYDLIKDFFIQVIAIKGDWTNYEALSADPTFSQYFNAQGLIPTQLNAFINAPQINLIGSWTGTIIPDFKDKTGANQYIEDIINSSTPLTGVLINVNNQALDNLIYDASQGQWELGDGSSTSQAPYLLDLVGHNYANSNGVHASFLSYDISVGDASVHTTIPFTQNPSINWDGRTILIDSSYASSITVGSLVKSSTTIQPSVTYVTNKIYVGANKYQISLAEPLYNWTDGSTNSILVQKTIDELATCYKFAKMDGLVITNNHAPGYDENGAPNAEAGVKKIYSMLYDPGIFRGLTNPDMISYRYIVDTMAYGLQPLMGGKSYVSKLAKDRGKCTAILNAPAMTQFITSQDPYFCDTYIPGVDPKPVFNTAYIQQGGNPDMARTFRFSFPDEDNGSKYCGVFGPFLRYNDNGTTILVPPAADVSNTYVRKFLGGNPYAICANKNGIISNPAVLGVEYMIDKTDRDYLEPMGYNSIIERPSTGEVMIYANATSYQTIKSDYNYLHVRELLNTIEIQIEEILKNYVFAYNNAVTRLNIVNTITPVLQSIQDAGALYKYEVIMDESNNTPEVIDDATAIIDIGVWITKGMQKIVNRITVNSLSGVSSGGFTTA